MDTRLTITSSLSPPPLNPREKARPKTRLHLWLPRLLHRLGEGLSPRSCAACRQATPPSAGDTGAFCEGCAPTLSSAAVGGCMRCGAITDDGMSHPPSWLCQVCLSAAPPYRRALGALRYGGAVRDAIIAWKNRPAFHLSRPLQDLYLAGLGTRLESLGSELELIVAVPTCQRQLARRGFNPAGMLAEAAQDHLRSAHRQRVPLGYGALRISGSPGRDDSSKSSSRGARLARARDSFVADPRLVQAKRVWLVDDVMTTGATVEACSLALLAAGARSVDVGVLARVEGLRSGRTSGHPVDV